MVSEMCIQGITLGFSFSIKQEMPAMTASLHPHGHCWFKSHKIINKHYTNQSDFSFLIQQYFGFLIFLSCCLKQLLKSYHQSYLLLWTCFDLVNPRSGITSGMSNLYHFVSSQFICSKTFPRQICLLVNLAAVFFQVITAAQELLPSSVLTPWLKSLSSLIFISLVSLFPLSCS